MNIAVVGLGLIGGSMAKAIKRATRHTVLGADVSEPALLKAELLGAIDARLTDEALATCDLVIVALYPRDTVDYILSHAHLFRLYVYLLLRRRQALRVRSALWRAGSCTRYLHGRPPHGRARVLRLRLRQGRPL